MRLYLFGPLRVADDGRPLALAAPPRTAPLLAYLALQSAPRDRRSVAAALWPDTDPDEARANLRRHLHYLRRALPEPGGAPWLLADGSRIGLNPEALIWVDVHAFEGAERAGDLSNAAALYTDHLLPDLDDEWLLPQRERLRDLLLTVLMALGLRLRDEGRPAEALVALERLLREDPLREDTVRTTMRLHAASGDRAGALATFERFAATLASELGVEPMRETRQLFEALVREIPSPAARSGAPGPPPLPFVGRQTELVRLQRLWQRAREGNGGLVLVGGPAGIGKSRLLKRLSQRVEADDGRALTGRTPEPENVPHEALVEALQPVLPLLLAAGDEHVLERRVLAAVVPGVASRGLLAEPLPELSPERERARLFHGLTRTLLRLASTRPLLLTIEDLHAAGEATVALLEHLARHALGAPLLIAASYREDALSDDHPLRALRRRLEPHGAVHHLALAGLASGEVAAALARLGPSAPLGVDDAPALWAASRGNPLFIAELLHEAAAGQGTAPGGTADRPGGGEPGWQARVPESVRERVAARLERLPADARTFARAASVVGDGFRLETVRAMLGWNEREALDALDVLLDARLVGERRIGSFAFGHQLMREAIYQGLTQDQRQRHHRRAAQALSRDPSTATRAAALVRHFDRAGEPELAAQHLLTAAQEALQAGAGDEARQLVERGLVLAREPRLRLSLLQLAEDRARRYGDRDRQRRHLDAMDGLAEALADDGAIVDALARRVMLLRDLGERPAEQALLDRISTLTARDGRPPLLGRAALLRAGRALVTGDYPTAESELEKAIAFAERAHDRRLRVAAACLGAHVALAAGKLERVQQHLDDAQAAGASDDPELLADALRASLHEAIGREAYDAGLELAGRLLALAVASGDRTLEADAHQVRAVCSARLARLSEARAHYRVAASIYHDLEHPQGQAAVALNRGLLDLRLGDHDAAAERLARAATLFAQLGDGRGETLCVLNGASALLYGARYAQAREAALKALGLARAANNDLLEASALSNLGDAERHLGANCQAIEHLCQAVAIEKRLEREASMANALCDLALAYLAEGQLDDAARAADELLELLAKRGDGLLHPQQVAWVAARVRRAQGREPEAHQLLRTAADRLEALTAAIDEDGARHAFLAMEFNREIAAAAAGRWP